MLFQQKLNQKFRSSLSLINILFLLTILIFAPNLTANIGKETSTRPNTEKYYYSESIVIEVKNFQQAVKLFRWLDLIKLTQVGAATFKSIENSGHQLLIYHSDSALLSAGVTGATLSRNLTNGVGENAYIKFFLDMENHGSNCVLGKNGDYILYSAVHNLFHELIHARHKMNGTWLYFDSEGQAIREENKFRKDWAQYRSTKYALRHEFMEDEAIILNKNGACGLTQSSLE